jgi:hypothetical protein
MPFFSSAEIQEEKQVGKKTMQKLFWNLEGKKNNCPSYAPYPTSKKNRRPEGDCLSSALIPGTFGAIVFGRPKKKRPRTGYVKT